MRAAASPLHGIALPLIQNAAGHVYCIGCERYFSPPPPPAAIAEWYARAAAAATAAAPAADGDEEEAEAEEEKRPPFSHRPNAATTVSVGAGVGTGTGTTRRRRADKSSPLSSSSSSSFAAPAGEEERMLFRQLDSWQRRLSGERDVSKCRACVPPVSSGGQSVQLRVGWMVSAVRPACWVLVHPVIARSPETDGTGVPVWCLARGVCALLFAFLFALVASS